MNIMSHITKSVENLAKLYSDFYQQQYTDVLSTIIGSITKTMSDRVAMNHGTVTISLKSLNEDTPVFWHGVMWRSEK